MYGLCHIKSDKLPCKEYSVKICRKRAKNAPLLARITFCLQNITLLYNIYYSMVLYDVQYDLGDSKKKIKFWLCC